MLSIIHRIKIQSHKSRQSLQRKLENDGAKLKENELRNSLSAEHYINEYKLKTALSNYVKCVECKANVTENTSATVQIEDDSISLLERRREKFHKCTECLKKQETPAAENGNVEEQGTVMNSRNEANKIVYFPLLNNVNIFTLHDEVGRNDEDSSSNDESNSVADVDPNAALDALIQLLSEDDNSDNGTTNTEINSDRNFTPGDQTNEEPSIEEEEGQGEINSDEKKFLTVLFPCTSKISELHVKRGRKSPDYSKLQCVLYGDQPFDENKFSQMYDLQVSKYLTSNRLYNGHILSSTDRTIQVEQFVSESDIRGSDKYNMRIMDEIKFKIEQTGHFCLRISVPIPMLNAETIASCLLIQNMVVTISLEGDSTNEMKRVFHVHTNHTTEVNCSADCEKVDLATFIDSEENFDANKIKNRFLSTYLLSCAKKMEEFVKNCVLCPRSNLYSKEYFFRLEFNINSEITIEGLIWPEVFNNYNLALASESFTGKMDENSEREFLERFERSVLCSSDIDNIMSSANVSIENAQNIQTKVLKYQVQNGNCGDAEIELPCLVTTVTKTLTTMQNSFCVKRFLEIFRDFLNNVSDFGRNTLTTYDWLENIWEERIESKSIDADQRIFSMVIDGEKLDFYMDDYFLELFTKWSDLPLLAPYHYSLCRSSSRSILFKRNNLLDSFTSTYCSFFISALDSPMRIDAIFGFSNYRRILMLSKNGDETHFLKYHKEISLSEAISLCDPRKFKYLSSRPVQYVHTLPESKLIFNKVGGETINSYQSETERNEFYEISETFVSRYFKRINGSNLLLAEFVTWYEFIGEKSSDVFTAYHNKLSHIEQSDVSMVVNEDEFLPVYILISNGDVLRMRKKKKILKHSNVEPNTYEYKFTKVLLFLNVRNYEDINQETLETLFNEASNPDEPISRDNPRLVTYRER